MSYVYNVLSFIYYEYDRNKNKYIKLKSHLLFAHALKYN